MKIISKNKIAYHDYPFEKDYEVGMILKGHEVKTSEFERFCITVDQQSCEDGKTVTIRDRDTMEEKKSKFQK